MGSFWFGEAESYYSFTVLSMSFSVFSIVGKLSVSLVKLSNFGESFGVTRRDGLE